MELDLRVRALDRVAKRLGTMSVARMSMDDTRRVRRSWLPTLPTALAPVTDQLGFALFGRPHRSVTIEDTTVPGPDGPLAVRLYRPQVAHEPLPLVVNSQGGGWVLGNLDAGDWLCPMVAGDAEVVVASVDYRLAPEHPAPAAREDAIAVTAWLVEHAETIGVDGEVAVMGDSAGGNLAALVALVGRDGEGPPIAHQVLIYPSVDLTRSHPSIERLADAPILTRGDIDAFAAHYLGAHGDPTDPRLSPWHVEDLSGVAPALVFTAEHDPLRDEGRAYVQRLEDAGVAVRFTDYAGMPHGFVTLPGVCRSAPQAVAEITQQLRAHLHGHSVR